MKTSINFIEQYDLLPKGSTVLCALSGGRDSVYLLHRLLDWAEHRNLRILAAHYNHHLRAEESDRDERFVRELCQELDVPLFVGGSDVAAYAQANALGTEEAARVLRYAFLEQTRTDCGADLIATAHHADDLAETMLFHLARGAGAKGLSGIPPRRGNIVRPILTVQRSEIDAYLEQRGISFVEDSTNLLDNGSRNILRHHVMPVLKELNPSFVAHAVQSALLLREDEAYIQSQADTFLNHNPIDKGIESKALCALPFAVSSRVIRTVWGEALQYEHVRQILELCNQTGLAYTYVPGAVIRLDNGRLWKDEPISIPQEISLIGDCGETDYGEFRVRWEIRNHTEEIHNSLNTFCLKYENMKGVVKVSSRREGDCIKFAGTNHTKKLKKLFSEQKFTQPQRAKIPVFRDEDGVIAVYGFGIAQRCIPEIGEKILYIQCDK